MYIWSLTQIFIWFAATFTVLLKYLCFTQTYSRRGAGEAERDAAEIPWRHVFVFGIRASAAEVRVSMPVLMVGSASGAHCGEWVPGSLVLSGVAA